MKKQTALLLLGIAFVALLVIASLGYKSSLLAVTYGGKEVKYTVPLMASIKCEKISSAYGLQYPIGQNGFWVSSSQVGGYTDGVRDIKVVVDNSWFDSITRSILGGGMRIYYKQCDQNMQNCIERTQSMTLGGTHVLQGVTSSMDLQKNSLYVAIQGRYTILSSWSNVDTGSNAKIMYSFDKYGLVVYSTVGVGIKTVCQTGCNLNCPDLTTRQTIVSTPNDNVNFNEAVNYIATWVDVSQSAPQLGGTIFNSVDQRFCFGGFLYNAGEISTETGSTFIYPKDYVGKKDCCVGAVISTSTEDKICQSDYTWKTITKDTRIKCTSAFQCPNQGVPTCQSRTLSGWSCSGYDSSIGFFCEKKSGQAVSCCINSDCPIDQSCQLSTHTCVAGNVQPPIDINKCTSDKDCKNGGNCVAGECKYDPDAITCAWYDVPCQFKKLINSVIDIVKQTLDYIFKLVIIAFMGLFSLVGLTQLLKLVNIKNGAGRFVLSLFLSAVLIYSLFAFISNTVIFYVIVGIVFILNIVGIVWGGNKK